LQNWIIGSCPVKSLGSQPVLVAKYQNPPIELSQKIQHTNFRKFVDLKLSSSETNAKIQ
jgi:hypothetical protein